MQVAIAGLILRRGILRPLQREHALHVTENVALLLFQDIADYRGHVVNREASAAPADAVQQIVREARSSSLFNADNTNRTLSVS